jgi:hypothetical protein
MTFNKNLTHSFQKRTNAIETKNMNKCSKKVPKLFSILTILTLTTLTTKTSAHILVFKLWAALLLQHNDTKFSTCTVENFRPVRLETPWKGSRHVAQGNALGMVLSREAPPWKGKSPGRRHRLLLILLPFQGGGSSPSAPRALPWATCRLPFQGAQTYRYHQPYRSNNFAFGNCTDS